MNQRKKSKHWKKIVSWILALCICMTSVEWPAVVYAEKNSEETHVQSEDANQETVYEESEDVVKTEIPEERTKNSTTWQLSNGMKQTVYYSSDVRYEDEEGELVDYDSSLVSVEEEDPVSSEAYLYVNARGDRKHYIPKEIGYDTPLLMENGEYSLEVNPLFGQTEEIPTDDLSSTEDVSKKEVDAEKKAGSINNSEAVKLNEADAEEFQKVSEDSNAFQELSSLEPVEVKQEKTADLYGDVEEKATSAVYSAPDQSFNLEYAPFESGVKENLILNEKPDTNVWQFAFTLGGGLTARKNVMNEGISFYAVDNDAVDSDDEKILVGGIQVPYMNDATEENYSENITYALETVSEEDGSYVLTMTVDPEYLNDPETVYPVTIDPSYSWTGGSAVYDVYVLSGSAYADMNFYDTSTTGMFAGRTNANGYERTYISFNGLADKISGYSVASAKLEIYESGGGTSGETVQAHTVKEAWNKSTLTWNNRPSYNTNALSSFTNNAAANHKGTLDITSYARGVAKGTGDYGIMLRTKDEAVSKYAKFYGSRHSSTAYRPKLTVTYIDKPATASSVSVSPVWAKKNAALSVTWADINSSALKSIQYRIALMSDDGQEFVNSEYAPYASNPVIGTASSGTATIDTTSLGEGWFRIYVRGVDQYGSVGAGKVASFVRDGAVPTLSSASLTPSTTSSSYSDNRQPVIKWSGASDKYLKQVQYSLDGGEYASMGTTASGSFTVPSGKITSTGKHTIKVRAIDKSGNVSTVKTLYYYYYDSTAISKPTTASSVSLESAYLKKGASLKVTWAGIESSALSKIEYKIASLTDDGATVENSELVPYSPDRSLGNTPSGTASISTTSLGEGYFRLYVRGLDKYGNAGTGKAVNFILDSTVPTLSSASLSPATSTASYSNNAAPTIKWSGASDRFFKKVQYSLDGGTYTQIGTTASGSFSIPAGKISTSGKHTIKVRAVDKCSNVSATKTLYYYYDITKPTGRITISDADGSDAGKYKITFTASDANSGLKSVVLKLSGGSLSSAVTLYSNTAGSEILFNPSEYEEGTYTLTLTITDKCGNSTTIKKTFSPIDLADWTPQNLTAQDKINYKTCLKWDRRGTDEIPDSVSYEIYRGTSAGFTPNESTLAVSGLKSCYWCEPNVNYGETYYYKVRAVRSNSGGTVTAAGSFSAEVSSTVVSEDEYDKRLGIKDYWGYQSLDTPVGTGRVEESKGNFVYQQEDVSLPSAALDFGITRTYNSQSTAKTAFGTGWDHNYNLEILKVCGSDGQETGSYVFKDGSGTIEHLDRQSEGTYVSGGTKEYTLYESPEPGGELLELDAGHEIVWNYRMEDKGLACWYFNQSGQAVAITEPTGTWIVLHYDEKQGMLSEVEASTGKVLGIAYQDDEGSDHLLVKTITLPDGSTLNYGYENSRLSSMTRRSADGEQSVAYGYTYTNNKVTSVLDAENNAYGISYDTSGRVTQLSLPDGETTHLSYSNADKKVTVTKKTASGSTILTETMTWNDAGNIVAYTDPLGRQTTYQYLDNCLVSTTEEIAWETIENGKVTFHSGQKTSITEYNDQGNVEQDTDGDGNTTVYTYGDDTNPNLVTKEVTSNGGTVISQTEYTYDDAGRVTAEADAVAGTESVYTYTDDPEQGYQVSTTEKQDEKTVSVSEEQYDAEGNLLNEENEAGGITVSSTNEYDEMGNLLESVSSDGSRTVYTYDFLGRLTKQQDYDKEGNLAQTLETSYFPNGQVKNETAADGTVTGYTYDSRNRLVTRKVTADGNTRNWTTAYGYGSVTLQDGHGTVSVPNAAKVTETDPAGTETVTWSDGCGQTVRTTSNGLNQDSFYDKSGQNYLHVVSAVSNSEISSVTLCLYDNSGNQTDVIKQPEYSNNAFALSDESIHTSQTYDLKGNVLSSTDELGNQTTYTYDGSGRLQTVKEGNETTSCGYTTESDGSSKTVITRANGSTSMTVEDGGGRTLYTMDEGSGKQIRISYSYGEDGELTKQTQPDGSSITYEYDSQGRTSAVDMLDADGEKVHRTEYRYDDSGRVTAMTDYEQENGGLKPLRYTGYSYNAFGELAESWEVDGTSSPTTAQKTAHLITYTYGADGSCTSVSYPDNGNGVEQLKYTYNSQKQLTKITAELSDGRTRTVSEYTYTADGKVAVRKDYEDFAGTGSQYIQRTYTYDSFDRVLSMVYNEGSTSDTPEESHTYQYDKASRIIHEETSLNWTGQTTAESEVKDYTYDAKGQLTKSVLLDQDRVQTTTEYTYDTVGNRLKQVETLFAQKENKQLRKEETSYTYNGLDQLLTSQVQETTATASASSVSSVVYSYDSNGNLTAAADSVKNTEIQYQYDPQGQMTGCLAKVNGTETCNQENSYNGDGQRILRSENGTETGYYYQNGTLLMTETGEGSLDSFYYLGVAGNPLLVMQMDAGNAGYYTFQKDAQGSTRAVIDSSGTCAEWYDYTDFGETTIHEEQEGFLNRICYTGGVYDENTELYYLNARYYNPETGRFLTRDSYRGEAEKPETLHLYLYCANDPVNYVDPSGHSVIAIGVGFGASWVLDFSAVVYFGIDHKGDFGVFATTTVGVKIGTGSRSSWGSKIDYLYVSNMLLEDMGGFAFTAGINMVAGPLDVNMGMSVAFKEKDSKTKKTQPAKMGLSVSSQVSKKLQLGFNITASGSHSILIPMGNLSKFLRKGNGYTQTKTIKGKNVKVAKITSTNVQITVANKFKFKLNSYKKFYDFRRA